METKLTDADLANVRGILNDANTVLADMRRPQFNQEDSCTLSACKDLEQRLKALPGAVRSTFPESVSGKGEILRNQMQAVVARATALQAAAVPA